MKCKTAKLKTSLILRKVRTYLRLATKAAHCGDRSYRPVALPYRPDALPLDRKPVPGSYVRNPASRGEEAHGGMRAGRWRRLRVVPSRVRRNGRDRARLEGDGAHVRRGRRPRVRDAFLHRL